MNYEYSLTYRLRGAVAGGAGKLRRATYSTMTDARSAKRRMLADSRYLPTIRIYRRSISGWQLSPDQGRASDEREKQLPAAVRRVA